MCEARLPPVSAIGGVPVATMPYHHNSSRARSGFKTRHHKLSDAYMLHEMRVSLKAMRG
jgi:hypothetical protein